MQTEEKQNKIGTRSASSCWTAKKTHICMHVRQLWHTKSVIQIMKEE
jgi:hypothetical protein